HKADPFHRLLRDAIHYVRGSDAGRLQDRRYNVNEVGELVADAALVLDHVWPKDRHALTYAAPMRRNLLGPREGRVERPCPWHRYVRVGLVRAPGVVELHLVSNRDLDAVERSDLVRRANQRALGAVAIVARDVDDQRVVKLADSIDFIDHPTDLVVGVGEVRCEDIRLADKQLLLIRAELVPVLQ